MNIPPSNFETAMSHELIAFATHNNIRPGETRTESERFVTGGISGIGESAAYKFGGLEEAHAVYIDPLTGGGGSVMLPVYYLEARTAQIIQPGDHERFEKSYDIEPLLLTMRSAVQIVETRYFSVMYNKDAPPLHRTVRGEAFNLTEDGKQGASIGKVPVLGEDFGVWNLRRPLISRQDKKIGRQERNCRDYDTVLRAFRAFGWRPHYLLGTNEND
jgi:hypothetical protein